MDNKDILAALVGLTPSQFLEGKEPYDQHGTFKLIDAILASGNRYLLWKALCIAHRNGMREASAIFVTTAENIANNTSAIDEMEFAFGKK